MRAGFKLKKIHPGKSHDSVPLTKERADWRSNAIPTAWRHCTVHAERTGIQQQNVILVMLLIYRGPGSFRQMIWLLTPPPLSVSKLDSRDTQEDCERETTCWQERGGDEGGVTSYNGEEAWSSMTDSILSDSI